MTPRLTAAVGLALGLLMPAVALANWNAGGGGGSGYGRATTLAAGNQPTVTASGRNLTVNWAASGGASVGGYVVKRYNGAGAAQSVGANCAGTIAATNCTEIGVAPGSWRYSVTPANGNWRGAESPLSAAATVGSPALTVSPASIPSLPATLSGQITSFVGGQTVGFRLDNQTTGPVLSGSITPSIVPAAGTAAVTVTVPAGTSPGAHTVYALGSAADTASAAIVVLTPQTLATTAWNLRDASSGTEADASDPFAFPADGLTVATTAPTTAFASTRYLMVDYSPALPTTATPSSASFNFRLASPAANTSCFYFEVRRASTNALLATHDSSAGPSGCVSSTTQTSFSTSLPEVSSAAIANDLRVYVFLRNSASKAPVVDEATVSTTTDQGAFTLYEQVVTDRVNTGTTDRSWPLAGAGATTYTSANWSSSFSSSRYLKLTLPADVPNGATVTATSFTQSYRAVQNGTVCWYFEVLQGSTVIGTHGSTAAPISCNSSTSAYQQDSVSLPEVDTPAKANGAVIRLYMQSSKSRPSELDLARVQVAYSN